MSTVYYIDITAGVISFFDHATAPRVDTEYHSPNAKQHFARMGEEKPAPVTVRGWPFEKMYLTNGTEENGLAVAWA